MSAEPPLPSGWEWTPIRRLGTIHSGGTPMRGEPRFWRGDVPWVTPGEVTSLRTKWLHRTNERITQEGLRSSAAILLPPGSVLVTSRATIGAVAIAATPVTTNQGFKSIVLHPGHDPRFVFHQVARAKGQLLRLAAGSTFPEISLAEFSGVRLALAPPDEQRRIADLLDAVDDLIAHTEAEVEKQRALLQGVALELIDQAHERVPLADILAGIEAGSSPLCPDRPAESGEWGVLKVSAVNPEGFRSEENKVVLREALVDPACEVRDGDLLMSRANTFELVGAVCLVRSPRRQLLLCDKTLRLNPRPERAIADYLFWALRAPSVRRQIERDATGTSGSMKNITQKSIRALSIASRSLPEQRRIVAILDDHDARIRAAQAERDKLVALKRGLLDDLLTGRVRVPAARME